MPSRKSDSGNQSPKWPPRCGEPPTLRPTRPLAVSRRVNAEGQRLVGIDPVDPQDDERVGGDDRERHAEPLERSAPVRHVAGPVEIVPAGEEQREDHHRCERPVVDSVEDVQRGRQRSDPDCHLPRPMTPANEPPRGDEQRDGRDDAERMSERPDRVGCEVTAEGPSSAPGSTAWSEVEQRLDADQRTDDRRRAVVAAADSEGGRSEADDHRRQVHGREASRNVERRAGGDLAHDGDRDARLQVGIGPDPDGEEQRGGQPFDPGPARVEAEQSARGTPDQGEPEERRRRVMRELVERQRQSHLRARDGRVVEVEPPAGGRRPRRAAPAAPRPYEPWSLRDIAIRARAALPRQMPQLWPPWTTK